MTWLVLLHALASAAAASCEYEFTITPTGLGHCSRSVKLAGTSAVDVAALIGPFDFLLIPGPLGVQDRKHVYRSRGITVRESRYGGRPAYVGVEWIFRENYASVVSQLPYIGNIIVKDSTINSDSHFRNVVASLQEQGLVGAYSQSGDAYTVAYGGICLSVEQDYVRRLSGDIARIRANPVQSEFPCLPGKY